MNDLERRVRSMGRKNFMKFRNTSAGVTAYLFDGVTKIVFENWQEAEKYLLEKEDGKWKSHQQG